MVGLFIIKVYKSFLKFQLLFRYYNKKGFYTKDNTIKNFHLF